MSESVVVVGSGASGVHFALTLLRQGRRVRMIDVGRPKPTPIRAKDNFAQLRNTLEDPAGYFLGRNYEAVILPGHDGEYYGFPPHKQYIFKGADSFRYRTSGFAPLVSFAAGGLAEAWTGGCYPFNEGELEAFPFGSRELNPYYAEVARRIGITGGIDDLSEYFPVHEGLLEPLELDEHSRVLMKSYERQRDRLRRKYSCVMGRARIATLSRDQGERERCDYLGRCLWGCPRASLYTPSLTLEECRRHPGFEYLSGCYVQHFRFDSSGQVRSLVATASDRTLQEFPVSDLVLAAGALCSSHIFLRSIYADSGEVATLRGLMDNRQVLMPFVNLRMIGRPYEPASYQYHQLAIGVAGATPCEYVHGLVTTLKTALIHPIVQTIPFDLGTSLQVFRHIHAALGLVNINFADFRREGNYLTLEPAQSGEPALAIHYEPEHAEAERLTRTAAQFRKILWALDCIAPPPMTHVRPMGASVHYAGTLPMSRTRERLTCSASGRSHDFSNLYFADGTTFPALPAKNLTFTLMANAIRIGRENFA